QCDLVRAIGDRRVDSSLSVVAHTRRQTPDKRFDSKDTFGRKPGRAVVGGTGDSLVGDAAGRRYHAGRIVGDRFGIDYEPGTAASQRVDPADDSRRPLVYGEFGVV